MFVKQLKRLLEFAPDWLLELVDLIDISTESASSCFDHTALVRVDSTSEECKLLMQFLVPDPPSTQDQSVVVLHESRQGDKVVVKQRPNEGSPMETLVVESLTKNRPGFWECQKDWMCALW